MKQYLKIGISLFTILMCMSFVGFAETDNDGNIIFEDANLELELLLRDVDTNYDERISPEEALLVEFLEIDEFDIISLEGIQYFENLVELSIDGQWDLYDITPLSNLTNLVELEVYDCSIEDVTPLENLVDLKYLDISGNNITDVTPLKNLVNLSMLMLYSNEISDISSLVNLVNLTDFEIDENNIEDISIMEGFENLEVLWINGNSITDISPILNLPHIDTLWIDSENLNELIGTSVIKNVKRFGLIGDFDEQDMLTVYDGSMIDSLTFGNNTMTNLDILSHFGELTAFEVWGSRIDNIEGLKNLTNLTDLEISYCPVSDISVLSSLSKLVNLEIDACEVSDISAIRNLTGLLDLEIDSCNVSDISTLSGLTNLMALDLQDNYINDISVLSELTNLKDLSLRENPINNSTTAGAEHIAELDFVVDGEEYEVWVIDAADDNSLYDLSTSAGLLDDEFFPEIDAYTVTVETDVDAIRIYPVSNSVSATVYVNDELIDRGYSSSLIDLEYGSTPVVITVVSDGGDKKTYSVDVFRLRNEIGSSKLKTITLSQGSLSPAFDASVLCYTAEVDYEVAEVEVSVVPDDFESEISINNTDITTTTSAAVKVELSVGTNPIDIVVDDYSGNDTSTYHIDVIRAASEGESVAILKSIELSDGTLNPVFNSGVYTYTVSVNNAIDKMTVWPTAKDVCAQVFVNEKMVEDTTSGAAITLDVGTNEVDVRVSSSEAQGDSTYRLNITRAPIVIDDDDDDDDDRSSRSSSSNTSTVTGTASASTTSTTSTSTTLTVDEVDSLMTQSLTESDNTVTDVDTAISSIDTLITEIGQTAEVAEENWAETRVCQVASAVEKQVAEMEVEAESITEYAVTTVQALEESHQTSQIVQTSEVKEAVESLGEQVSQKIGRIVPESDVSVSGTTTYVKPKAVSLVLAIQKQARLFEKMESTLNSYYGAANVRDFEFEVTIDTKQQGSKDIAVVLEKVVQQSIKSTNVDRIAVESEGVKLGIDKADLTGTSDTEIRIAFNENPESITALTTGVTKGVVVDVRFYENNIEKDVLNKPAVLTFDLSNFEFEDRRPVGAFKDQLSIYRLNTEANIWEPVGGQYDPVTNTISTKRIHLSQYTVMKSNKHLTDGSNTDISAEIAELMNKGIIDESTDFENESITREELASWVTRANGLSQSYAETTFDDIDKDSVYYEDIASGYEAGLFSGKSETAFDPDGEVTREELAVLLGKALAEYDQKTLNKSLKENLQAFEDNETASEWSQDYLAMMIELDIMPLDEARLNPQSTVSKEMAAEILKKIYS